MQTPKKKKKTEKNEEKWSVVTIAMLPRIKAEHPMIKANRGHETCWQLYYPKSQTREVRIDNCRETSALTGSYREETALGRKHYRDNPNTNYTRTSMSCIGCRGKWNGQSEMSSLMYQTICLCSTQKSIKKKKSKNIPVVLPSSGIRLIKLPSSSLLLQRVHEGATAERSHSDFNCNGYKSRPLQAFQQSASKKNIAIMSH